MPNPLYADTAGVIDLAYLVAAFAVDGSGPDDGRYCIAAVVHVRECVTHLLLPYASKEARDAALVKMGQQAYAYAEAMTAEEDEGDDEDDTD